MPDVVKVDGGYVLAQFSSGGTPTAPKLDSATSTVTTIDYGHHEAHAGSSFYFHDVISLGNGAAQDYLLTTPNTAKWAHLGLSMDANDGASTVEIYEATDKTGTTAQTVFNRDRNSATTSTTTIHKGTSGGTTDGTRIFWKRGGSGKTISATLGSAEERILKQNTKYILRVTNATTVTNNVSVVVRWYEHTNVV